MRSASQKYSEPFLWRLLHEVVAVSAERICMSRGALFNWLIKHHIKPITPNACTRQIKRLPPLSAFETTIRLGRFFQLGASTH